MTRKTKAKPKASNGTRATTGATDDRHLTHPHAEPVDPAGGAVFDDATGATAVAGEICAEPPAAESESDAIGFTLLGEECAEPDDDDGTGVGAVVEDECDQPAEISETATTAASRPSRVAIATAPTPSGASASAGSGSAVLPDGRVSGTDGDIREGFGLVFSK